MRHPDVESNALSHRSFKSQNPRRRNLKMKRRTRRTFSSPATLPTKACELPPVWRLRPACRRRSRPFLVDWRRPTSCNSGRMLGQPRARYRRLPCQESSIRSFPKGRRARGASWAARPRTMSAVLEVVHPVVLGCWAKTIGAQRFVTRSTVLCERLD